MTLQRTQSKTKKSASSSIDRSWLSRVAAAPHIVWSLLFIVAPLMFVAYFAFTDTSGASLVHTA